MKAPEVLQDRDGDCSAKRVGFFVCVILLTISWIANVFCGITTDANLITAISALGGLNAVGVAAERFGP